MDRDCCIHKDLSWDGWVGVLVTAHGCGHAGREVTLMNVRGPVNAFPNPSPSHLPSFHIPPFLPMLQIEFRIFEDGCSAVSPTKWLSHQTCDPQWWAAEIGVPSSPDTH